MSTAPWIIVLLVLAHVSFAEFKAVIQPPTIQRRNRMPDFVDEDIFVASKNKARTESLGNSWVNYSDPALLWNPLQIPYFIDPSLANYSSMIKVALAEFSDVSCLRFYELLRKDYPRWPLDYLYFNNTKGCASFIGRQGGAQLVAVEAEKCTGSGLGTIMHLIFHALGFGHEHNRPDRDKAVNIHWTYVNETKREYLIKYNGTDAATYNEPYDYGSLLHGGNYLFTTNNTKMTITARNDSTLELGQRRGFSNADIRRLNAHYSCASYSTTDPTTSTSTVVSTTPYAGCNAMVSPTCVGETRPTLADPTDCTMFYVCQGNQLIRMPCPEGLYYNPVIFVCDWPWATVCCSDKGIEDHQHHVLLPL